MLSPIGVEMGLYFDLDVETGTLGAKDRTYVIAAMLSAPSRQWGPSKPIPQDRPPVPSQCGLWSPAGASHSPVNPLGHPPERGPTVATSQRGGSPGQECTKPLFVGFSIG